MAHTVYENFVLENKIESSLISKLGLSPFMTLDTTLTAQPGMKVKIAKKTVAGEAEELEMGEGNTSSLTVNTEESEYEVKTGQVRFEYYDEEEMRDPLIVDAGVKALADKLANRDHKKAIAEFEKATLKHEYSKSAGIKYDDVVDAVALLNLEDDEDVQLFMLISPTVKAGLRKNLKDDLKYVEAFARTGYIGSVNGVNVYTRKGISDGNAIIATKEAVTDHLKKGVEVERERDADHRKTTIIARKVSIPALTDATKVVLIAPNASSYSTQAGKQVPKSPEQTEQDTGDGSNAE